MARPHPHHLALFSLIPLNDRAHTVLAHPDNASLVSLMPGPENRYGLDIGFHVGSSSRYTLATLGRSGADITVEGSSISRIQCSFEVLETSGVIMLYDRSNSMSTQVSGINATPFEPGRPRRVVVGEKFNTEIGMGGASKDLLRFALVWHRGTFDVEEQVKNRVDNPRLARTVDETLTVLPSQRLTRIHTPGNRESRVRYAKLVELGRGQFGEVWKAVDVDSGRIFAVKMIKQPTLGFQAGTWVMLKREVETLSLISHPHIVEYIFAQLVEGQVEIFTALKEGSIEDLICQNLFTREPQYADPLLNQMLLALDYLDYNGILHRDVKPANILYTTLPTRQYTYQLTDFGLCNVRDDARTYAGSPNFMAPEVLRNQGARQSSKVDVWSLFVTLVYAIDVAGYRKKPLHTTEQKITAVLEAAQTLDLRPLKSMAIVDPEQRASAAQMIVKLYGGKGLTTPRKRVLVDSRVASAPSANTPQEAANKSPVPTAARSVRPKPRNLPRTPITHTQAKPGGPPSPGPHFSKTPLIHGAGVQRQRKQPKNKSAILENRTQKLITQALTRRVLNTGDGTQLPGTFPHED